MKRFGILLLAILAAWAALYAMRPLLLHWTKNTHRLVIREQPLQAPIPIVEVRGITLISPEKDYTIAGVLPPTDPALAAQAQVFLRVIVAQGIEVVRTIEPGGTSILSCEPRIWHWCGNDPVRAHFERLNLNELLLAFGYATFDPSAPGLSDDETRRFKASEKHAQQQKYGIWAPVDEARYRDENFDSKAGLNISAVLNLNVMIEVLANSRRHSPRARD